MGGGRGNGPGVPAGGNLETSKAGNLVAGLAGLKNAFPPVRGAALAVPTKDFHLWEPKIGVHSAENHLRDGKPLLLGGQTASSGGVRRADRPGIRSASGRRRFADRGPRPAPTPRPGVILPATDAAGPPEEWSWARTTGATKDGG